MSLLFWRRKQRERDLEDEIQSHLAMAERDHLSQKQFGNVGLVKETTRDMWGWRWMADLLQDLRYGLRLLGKNPGFTAVAVLTLALGIGANTAIFSLVDTVMLKMLPVQRPEELMVLAIRQPQATGEPDPEFTNPIWEQIRDQQDIFSGVFAWSQVRFDLAQGGESHLVNGLYVSGDYFNTLGVAPATGRLFVNNDDMRGCAGSAVLGYGFWQEHFGGAPNAVGSMISLSDHPFQIIGVAAPGFFGVDVGNKFDVAIPLCAEAIIRGRNSNLDERAAWWLSIVGRPKSGIGPEQGSARLQVISPQVFAPTVPQKWKPDSQKNFLAGVLVEAPAGKGLSEVRRAYDQPLRMLMALVGLVLLIACANIASLMLARAATRQKEISVRLAVGASRGRLVRQLLTECVLLSCAGAALGVLFARWGCGILVRFISSPRNPVFLQFAVDSRVLGFTAAIAVLTGVLFGILPALHSTRVSLSSAMKGGQQDETPGRAHFRPGRWIVACQVALSLVLLIVAGLFLRSFNNLLTLDIGFDRSNVMMVSANSHNANLPPEQRETLWRQALQRLQAIPGVTSVSESVITPISGVGWNSFFHRQTGASPAGRNALANINAVSPDYFATLRSPILAGRTFDASDANGAPLVGIINETMARRFYGHADPIGQYVYIDQTSGVAGPPIQIIGIVTDAKYRTLRETTPATIYLPVAQLAGQQAQGMSEQPFFEIRTSTPPAGILKSAADVFTSMNGSISLTFRTMEEQVNDSLRQDQLLATLSGFFGGLAVLLAMIGLYGVLAYMVTQRRKEIGIRMALGAGKGSILGLILRDVSVLLAVGIAAGIGISLWATKLMQKMLFELSARDWKTITFSAGLLICVALVASYLPARRAANLDPNATLRDE
jgi:putative ABC transport system permease protein